MEESEDIYWRLRVRLDKAIYNKGGETVNVEYGSWENVLIDRWYDWWYDQPAKSSDLSSE